MAEEARGRSGLHWSGASPPRAGGAAKESITTTAHMSDWMPRSSLGQARRRGHPGAIITPGVAAEGEVSRSTGSPGHSANVQKMAKMAEEGLERLGDTRAKGLMEVGKGESRRELVMAARGGQEEVAMAIKWMVRGRGCASTEGSKSIACDRRNNAKSISVIIKTYICLLMSSDPKNINHVNILFPITLNRLF